MVEPFKNFFSPELVKSMAKTLHKTWPEFDHQGFVEHVLVEFDALELKQRSNRICEALTEHLPDDFESSAKIITDSLGPELEAIDATNTDFENGLTSWMMMPVGHYVGLHGTGHFDIAMDLLKELTKRFSAEFAIRFIIIDDPERTMARLIKWTKDPNVHVRRLASEGTRPRLPWGQQLPMFIKDPTPVIALLEQLKDDEEEYVRRSVANNLNDIAKDHPDLVAKIAKDWMVDASKNRKRLVRHALRTLIKDGHPGALKALGFGTPEVDVKNLTLSPTVTFGEALTFSADIQSTSDAKQSLIIDFIIHHKKANGGTSPKVFKWKTVSLEAGDTLNMQHKHPMKPITTRKYYPGEHRLEIQINGMPFGSAAFELLV